MSNNETGKGNVQEISPDRYIFWLNDLSVLTRDNNFMKFIPTREMTRVEQLNSISLLCAYSIIIFAFLNKSEKYYYIPIMIIVVSIILFFVFEEDDVGKKTELRRIKNINRKKDSGIKKDTLDDNALESSGIKKKNKDKNTEYELESGIYDSDGMVIFGKYKSADSKRKIGKKMNFTLDEIRTYQKDKCRKSTQDNPFMNPSLDDMNNHYVPVACNADDKDIGEDISFKFNEDIYRDFEDAFNVKNSQRQFFTVQQQNPNDQDTFARWCYGFPESCKRNPSKCGLFEDRLNISPNFQ
jgi:hypothetical protein